MLSKSVWISVIVGPRVLRQVRVHDLLHGVVGDELIRRQLGPGDWVEVSDAVEVLLNVSAVVRDARRGDDGLAKDFKADAAAQDVGHVPLLTPLVHAGEQAGDLSHALIGLAFNLLNLEKWDLFISLGSYREKAWRHNNTANYADKVFPV